MDNKTDAKKPVVNENNKTPQKISNNNSQAPTKTKQKDLSKIHRVVNHTGLKVITSIGMLLVIGACGYATYKFIDLEYKGFAFFVTFAVMLWGNVTASAPLGMKYKRHCPLGTKHGNPEKHPSQLT